jgi:hypothetical protein
MTRVGLGCPTGPHRQHKLAESISFMGPLKLKNTVSAYLHTKQSLPIGSFLVMVRLRLGLALLMGMVLPSI